MDLNNNLDLIYQIKFHHNILSFFELQLQVNLQGIFQQKYPKEFLFLQGVDFEYLTLILKYF